MTPARGLLLHPDDSVVQLLEPVAAGGEVVAGDVHVVALDDVPSGHKLALVDLAPGDVVRKYGEAIGVATAVVHRGEHVHVHNVRSARARAAERA